MTIDKLKLVWAVLRGRPVMYRMTVKGGSVHLPAGTRGARIYECRFVGTT